MKIKSINARKILNSAGKWTIEAKVKLEDGSSGVASCPGGISRGKGEVVSLPADKAVKRVGEISSSLINKEFSSQEDLDRKLTELDGTENKSKLGGNTILSLSIAFCKATAKSKRMETYEHIRSIYNHKLKTETARSPRTMMLMLEGGLHGSSNATIQEFMVIVDSLDRGIEIYHNIQKELNKLGKSTNVGAEGAFSPEGYDNDQMLSLLSGFLHEEKIALDIAASSFPDGVELPNYDALLKDYPIASIEDPYSEDDWTSWELFAQKYTNPQTSITSLTQQETQKSLLIVTDDITTTNPKLLKRAIERDIGNGVIVKPNQIGTVTETLKVVKMAKDNGWQVIVSHRGTDTNDDFIADLAIGVNSEYVKFGAPARGERIAKYNRLLKIGLIPIRDQP